LNVKERRNIEMCTEFDGTEFFSLQEEEKKISGAYITETLKADKVVDFSTSQDTNVEITMKVATKSTQADAQLFMSNLDKAFAQLDQTKQGIAMTHCKKEEQFISNLSKAFTELGAAKTLERTDSDPMKSMEFDSVTGEMKKKDSKMRWKKKKGK